MTQAELDFYTRVPRMLQELANEMHALNEKLETLTQQNY